MISNPALELVRPGAQRGMGTCADLLFLAGGVLATLGATLPVEEGEGYSHSD